MPKTRFDKIARDPLKELVLGRKAAVRISEVNLAKKMGISTGRLRTMFSGPSDSWKIGEVKALSRALDMPIGVGRADDPEQGADLSIYEKQILVNKNLLHKEFLT